MSEKLLLIATDYPLKYDFDAIFPVSILSLTLHHLISHLAAISLSSKLILSCFLCHTLFKEGTAFLYYLLPFLHKVVDTIHGSWSISLLNFALRSN